MFACKNHSVDHGFPLKLPIFGKKRYQSSVSAEFMKPRGLNSHFVAQGAQEDGPQSTGGAGQFLHLAAVPEIWGFQEKSGGFDHQIWSFMELNMEVRILV
jgi:hypothetical protein